MGRFLARVVASTAALLAFLFSLSVVASAAVVVVPTDTSVPGEVGDGAPLLTTIYEPWWTLIVTLLIPSIVGWITDSDAPSFVKTWSMIALTGLTSILAEIPVIGGGASFDLMDILERWFVLVVTAFLTHQIAKRAGVAGAGSRIAESGLHLGA